MLSLLTRASIEGALLAAAVWLIGRTFTRLSPTVRAFLWWCVAAKFVVTLLWRVPIGIPVLPPAIAHATSTHAVGVVAAPGAPSRFETTGAARVVAPPSANSVAPDRWTLVLLALWFAGVAISFGRTIRCWFETCRIVSRALPAGHELQTMVGELSQLLGIARVVDVRSSADIESPMITGLRTPVILVPIDRFSLLTEDQQRMALCHELAHLKRGDVWFGCVPAAVERCFFFHPLARLAAREYAFWREAACDEAVLATLGESPRRYGQLLLALGVSRQPTALAVAGAAWSFSNLKRRVTMLSHPSSPSMGRRLLATGAIALVVVAVAPVKAVARATEVDPSTQAASPSNSAAPMKQALAVLPVVSSSRAPAPSAELHAPAPAHAGSATPVVAEPTVQPSREQQEQEYVRFVYLRDDENTTMSGSSRDVARAKEYRRSDEPLLWFRYEGREYIVRDRNVLRDVDDLWKPVNRIGEEQGKIGAEQGAIGAEQGKHGGRQGEIGAAQGVIGARQGVIAARLGLLAAREAQGVSNSEKRDMDREREELSRDMRALDREMQELGKQMREFNAPMRELGDDMAVLGRQMAVLGRQMQEASARANRGMQVLVERAIRSGVAQEVR